MCGSSGQAIPEKTVEEFFTAMGKWDFDAMKRLSTASSGASFDQAKQQLNSNPLLATLTKTPLQVSEFQVVETRFEGAQAKVHFKVKIGISMMGKSMNQTVDQTATLVKEGGVWKMDASQGGAAQAFGGKMGF